MHECDRVYFDRLVDSADREKFRTITKDIIKKILEKDMDPDPRKENDKKIEIQKVELNVAEIYPDDSPPSDKDKKMNIFCNFA